MLRDRGFKLTTSLSTICRFAAGAAVIGLSACAIVDKFGERVVDYNMQAESTKNVGILLNVMRSAYRRPLQFSDFTQVSGTAAASAMASFTLPFGVNSVANYGATPSASMSGGPTFTVANLDTQAFYNGILHPIDPKIMALFIKRGVPRLLALTLLVDTIDIIKDHGDKMPPTDYPIYNNVNGEGDQYENFRRNLIALWRAGLDMEEVSSVTHVGPPLSDDDVKNLKVADLAAQKLTVKRYDVTRTNGNVTSDDSGLSASELKQIPPKWDHFYLIEKKSDSSYQFCFDPNDEGKPKSITDEKGNPTSIQANESETIDKIDPGSLCGAPKKATPEQAKNLYGEAEHSPTLGVYGITSATQAQVGQTGRTQPPKYQMSLRPRSTADVFWYLGQIARSELGINGSKRYAPTVWIAKEGPEKNKPEGKFEALFTVSDHPLESTLVWESYLGTTYWVPMAGPSGDRSGEVMELVKELIALNSSTQDLPAPAVISIIR